MNFKANDVHNNSSSNISRHDARKAMQSLWHSAGAMYEGHFIFAQV